MKFPDIPPGWAQATVRTQAETDVDEPSNARVLRIEPREAIDLLFDDRSEWVCSHCKAPNVDDCIHTDDGKAWECYDCGEWQLGEADWKPTIDLVIVSGEVGPDARPLHPDWVRAIRDQCVAAGVPFWFAGWGDWGIWPQLCFGNQRAGREAFEHEQRPGGSQTYFGYRVVAAPGGGLMTGTTPGFDPLSIAKIGATLSGRLLDGREWNELPKVLQ